MDKPKSMPMKDFLIRKLAVKLMINETIVDKVVMHNYSYLNRKLKDVNSIEFSGFGKIIFNRKKALKRIESLEVFKTKAENAIINAQTEKEDSYHRKVLENILIELEYLKNKTNEQFDRKTKTDKRGMGQLSASSGTTEN